MEPGTLEDFLEDIQGLLDEHPLKPDESYSISRRREDGLTIIMFFTDQHARSEFPRGLRPGEVELTYMRFDPKEAQSRKDSLSIVSSFLTGNFLPETSCTACGQVIPPTKKGITTPETVVVTHSRRFEEEQDTKVPNP